MAYSQFYMIGTGVGSNLNSGSTSSGTATYTSTSGTWSTVTNIFVPTDGSTPASSVNVGDWVSIYPNANTTTPFIAQVTAVAAGVNGGITVSTTNIFGTAPTTAVGTISLKAGGAWADLAMLASGVALNTGTIAQSTQINVKASTYANTTTSRTFALNGTTIFPLWWRGYQTTPGDWDGIPNPTLGTNVPLFTGTTGVFVASGNYQLFYSMAFTSGTTTSTTTFTPSGSHIRLFGVQVATTSTNSGALAFSNNSLYGTVKFCAFTAPTTANFATQIGGSGLQTYDCVSISGGITGFRSQQFTAILNNILIYGQAGDSILCTTGQLDINYIAI
ncbi:MAG TPA: hypothetical protein VGF75_02770, partial [Candidatus Saccharimonadales bacterium]